MSLVRTLSHADGNHVSAVQWVATGVREDEGTRSGAGSLDGLFTR